MLKGVAARGRRVKIKEPTAPSLHGRLPFTTFPLGEGCDVPRTLHQPAAADKTRGGLYETNGEHFCAGGTGFVKVRGLC